MTDIALILFFVLSPVFLSVGWVGMAVISSVIGGFLGLVAWLDLYDKTDFDKIPHSWWGGL